MGQCSFLLTVLAFRCPLSVYSQIDSGCGIKIVAVFVSAKNTLSRHQPTNPDPGSVSTTSVQNKQPPAPNASNQNNQSTQTGVKKFSSPKRTPTRHSAAKDFSVWRQACFHHGPENGIQKTSRNMAAIKGPRLYKKQIGTHREKKHVLTLTLMLVRRKSACKTSAGSSKIFRWLAPLLGPNLDPKTGPKQRPERGNENVIQFWTPFWGPYLDPKMGSAIRRISLLPANVLQADLRPRSLNMNVNTYLFLFVRPKAACYCTRNKLGRTERKSMC